MSIKALSETVIASNLCIGCGLCAHLSPEYVSIELNSLGFLKPKIKENDVAKTAFDNLSKFCPMSGEGPNEDSLADSSFSSDLHKHPKIGSYLVCYASRIKDSQLYNSSSSGGVGRWLVSNLMTKGIIDAAAIVLPNRSESNDEPLFKYGIVSTPQEVIEAATSAYYPVEMSAILNHIRTTPGRYAITALPCFAKALRTLCLHDSVMKDRIVVIIGVVCGHLKSTFYAELLGWQLGVPPDDLCGINFRVKIPGCKANEKGVTAYSRKNPDKKYGPIKVQNLYGTNYGEGFFKYEACDYCDDVVAETADVSIGDAWLPQFLNSGTSLVIVRQKWIQDFLEVASNAGELTLEPITAKSAALSQDSGLRHRREGLAYRLHLADQVNKWRPEKRVAPDEKTLTFIERSIHRYRMLIAKQSTQIFSQLRNSGTVDDLKRLMAPLIEHIRQLVRKVKRR